MVKKYVFLTKCETIFFQIIFFPLTAEEWGLHRRLIQPLFKINALQEFLSTFIDASNILIQRLKDFSHTELNITSFVNQCVVDILHGSCLFYLMMSFH